MEMIRIYNDETLEHLDKEFKTAAEADSCEILLDFMRVDYDRFSDGKLVYSMIR